MLSEQIFLKIETICFFAVPVIIVSLFRLSIIRLIVNISLNEKKKTVFWIICLCGFGIWVLVTVIAFIYAIPGLDRFGG